MPRTTEYYPGNTITLEATLTTSGVPGDVRFWLEDPDGAESELPASDMGGNRYTASFTPTKSGIHKYRLEATGPPSVAREKSLFVRESFRG